MRRALLIGINDYDNSPLNGCVNDAEKMANILATHENEERNFDCQLYVSDHDDDERINKRELKTKICELFEQPADVALLYFSGHGSLDSLGAGGI